MRVRLALIAVLVLGAACSGSTSSNISNSPAAASASRTTAPSSPTASAPTKQDQFAVIFTSSGPAAPAGSILTIVGPDGRFHGQTRVGDDLYPAPIASTTRDAVYYLYGNALMRLQPDGTAEHIRDLPVSANVHVGFAVSPDDKRIAIATLAFAPMPSPTPASGEPKYLGMKLFVEDLDGSHHVDIFSSTTVAEWPVGWHGADLVIAVHDNPHGFAGSLTPDPYFAFGGIHVAAAATGVRKATLCGGLPAVGLATPKGVLCAKENELGSTTITPVPMALSDWSGQETDTGLRCVNGGLQPDGDDIACDTGNGGVVLSPGGNTQPFPTPPIGPWQWYMFVCWVGHDHLLLEGRGGGAALYDVVAGTTQQLDLRADATLGVIPGGL